MSTPLKSGHPITTQTAIADPYQMVASHDPLSGWLHYSAPNKARALLSSCAESFENYWSSFLFVKNMESSKPEFASAVPPHAIH